MRVGFTLRGFYATEIQCSHHTLLIHAVWPMCLGREACPTSSTTSSPGLPTVSTREWPLEETGTVVMR